MTKKQKKTLLRVILALALLLAVSLIDRLLPVPGWLALALYLVPYLTIGYDVLVKAGKGIRNRQPFDECFLMAVATIGAMALGEYREGVAVMLFYQIGELFQGVAVGRSRRSISDLMDIRPDSANLELEDGTFEETDPDDIPVGSVIVVQPGERIPIDGDILEGSATLDTAALTGESLPREVQAGDSVLSGCIDMTGVLRIRTTKEFGASTVSKILDLVENSSMKKARMENFITRFARYYTPAVCYAALALAILPPAVGLIVSGEANWGTWVYRALTFLVISCPCALVISIPLSFFGGIGGASSQGILVKGSNYLEALAETDCVVFDKTGTLTQGVFQVTEVHPAQGISRETLLERAALAESYSNHPISRSLKAAVGQAFAPGRVTGAEEVGGRGVTAQVDGRTVAVGNPRLMDSLHIAYTPADAPGTVLHVAEEGQYLGYILISDVVKPNAKKAIAGLKAAGVTQTVMLTGDNQAAAQAVAGQLGIDQYYAQLLPSDKVDQVEALLAQQGKGKKLAFVGDGINDAPVLSRADVGIAMGALGSDAAIEAADIVLMDDDPAKISLAMQIARKTLAIVHENIVFALTVKALCLVLGAMGVANMWWAVFADVGVMVLAVLNAMRALRQRPSP